jgi:hypothetical protein
VNDLKLSPCTISEARRFVGEKHRHNLPPQGGLFACKIVDKENVTRGVAIVGRPVARKLDDGYTAEITRCCTDGVSNGCSMLYGATVRACRALGFKKVITYTLQKETGASLKASNWKKSAELPATKTWHSPSRPRYQQDIFGNERRPADAKIRWEQVLNE